MSDLLGIPLLGHPFTALALSLAQFVLVLGFTAPSSPIRLLGMGPMLGYVYLCLHATETHRHIHSMYRTVMVSGTGILAFQYLDAALLSRWAYSARGPTSALGGQKSLRSCEARLQGTVTSRLLFGWEEAFRARSARSPWAVPNLPSFYPDDPDRLPTRGQVVRGAALRCLVCFLVVDTISWTTRGANDPSLFVPSRIPLFARWRYVTRDELMVRSVSSLMQWVVFAFVLQAYHDITILLVIGLGRGRIEKWPPLFNRWRECWSIRRFWGSFWHQCIRQRFTAPANFLAFSMFNMRPGTLLAKYTILVLTFLFSGAYHQVIDMVNGVPWQDGGTARFFLMQAFGIMFEDTIQDVFRGGRERKKGPPTGWRAVLGPCWLLLWLIWTTPLWAYPIAHRSSGERILPFGILT
ncbi:MAG: hypothetical protein LQ339_003138 [Xanthoria mediterranea]|nr:MAG: hypothetical protein LQ339_003138 [Xanthoria mediterranea]